MVFGQNIVYCGVVHFDYLLFGLIVIIYLFGVIVPQWDSPADYKAARLSLTNILYTNLLFIIIDKLNVKNNFNAKCIIITTVITYK